jgi:hypothetical protein
MRDQEKDQRNLRLKVEPAPEGGCDLYDNGAVDATHSQPFTSTLDAFATKHYKGGQIKEGVMGGACSTHGSDKKCKQDFSW